MKRALLIVAALLATNSAHAKVIAVFEGNNYIFPIALTDEPCVPGKPEIRGNRAIMLAYSPADTNDVEKIEACWAPEPNNPDVIDTCLTKGGERNGLVGGDCKRISKRYFIDPASLPRSAF